MSKKKLSDDEKKGQVITVRTTTEEKNLITDKANKANMKVSEFVLNACKGKEIVDYKVSRAFIEKIYNLKMQVDFMDSLDKKTLLILQEGMNELWLSCITLTSDTEV